MNFLDFGRFLAGAAREKSSNCVSPALNQARTMTLFSRHGIAEKRDDWEQSPQIIPPCFHPKNQQRPRH